MFTLIILAFYHINDWITTPSGVVNSTTGHYMGLDLSTEFALSTAQVYTWSLLKHRHNTTWCDHQQTMERNALYDNGTVSTGRD